MKKLVLSCAVAFAAISFTSCDKLKELVPPFDITLPEVPIVVQATAVSSTETTLGTGTYNYDINAEIKKYVSSASISSVSSVKIKSVNISMPGATAAQNLSNFSSLRILLTTNSNSNEAVIATANPPVDFTQQLTASASDTELKSYLSGSQYNYNVKGVVRKAITTPTTIMVSAVITVKP